MIKPGNNNFVNASGRGFTLVEVIVAGSIMIILCVGILTTFSYVVKINRGENLRAQALTVLQAEVEHYRSLKFIPGGESSDPTILNSHRPQEIQAGTYTRPPRQSADGRWFNISVTVINIAPPSTQEHLTRYKEITITAVPQIPEQGWLSNLRTNVTIQRVRSN